MDRQAKNTVLVVGGGVAGMQASLLLAERGHRVVVAEEGPALGGHFPLLDNQFPTQSCGVCFMAPKTPTYCPFAQCELHPNIESLTLATVAKVTGQKGNFAVTLSLAPAMVDKDRCTDCGACEPVCPVEVKAKFGDGLETRKAIYRAYPKAVGKGYAIDSAACTRCGACVKACASNAVNLDAAPSETVVEAGAVVLATGRENFDASLKGEYGFGRYPNVLSAVKFERMLAKGSPSSGMPVRPSDNLAPKSIAFIQCVGSRDPAAGRGHCSSVCCMFTLKQALFARERLPDSKITVYYMDLRAFGKDYEQYLKKAEAAGIEFVRAIPSTVRHLFSTNDLALSYSGPAGKREERTHSLLVLANGFEPSGQGDRVAALFGVDLGAPADEFSPSSTMVPGVFTAGMLRQPKDIPETAFEASAAAANAAACLSALSTAETPLYPKPGDFLDEQPKIGVVLCQCDGYTSRFLDFDTLKADAQKIPGVDFVEVVNHACSKAGMNEVRGIFAQREPNRLLMASCTHKIVGDLYEHMFREAGVHPGVFKAADLRGVARAKDHSLALKEIGSAASSLCLNTFSAPLRVSASESVLVVGGGAAGMAASLTLANLGHTVHLVEKTGELGGNLKSAAFTIKGGDPRAWLKETAAKVASHPLIRVYMNSVPVESRGRIGSFTTRVETREGSVEILHGGTLIATGAMEAKPQSNFYGQSGRVMTQKELEGKLSRGELTGGRVAMLQCVDSREDAPGCRPWCSRVCCTHAVKNAREIVKRLPSAQVTVFYRDLRTYGHYEYAYEAARTEGVLFTSFDLSSRPEIKANGSKVTVRYQDPILGTAETLEADWLVLSAGMAPDAENARNLGAIFGVEVDENGFFTPKSEKAATTDFTKPGIYLAGLAHSPKHAEEALAQATGAAGRLSALLAARVLEAVPNPSYVDENICSRCGLCVEACPYGARELDYEQNLAVVDQILCRACGACTTVCPNKAARQHETAPGQLMAALDELL